jgi:hypothetical protein
MNPEFQRNLWLEAGPRRLAWTAVALAAVYVCSLIIGEDKPITALGIAGALVFTVAGLLWGPRIAGRAVGDEVAQRTWDFQRLSALQPWSMTWGKLFGATALSWVAALTGLVFAALAAIESDGLETGLKLVVGAVSGAVLLQAGSMALALVGVRRARAEGRSAAFRFTFGGFIALFVIASVIGRTAPGFGPGRILGGFPMLWGRGENHWWGVPIDPAWFFALSLTAFAGFAVLGAWRLMRLELQMRNFPWAWTLFVVFAGAWAAGLAEGAAGRWAAAGMVFAICAYVSAFTEPAERVRLRQFVAKLNAGDVIGCAYDAPAVIAPLKLAALAVIGLSLSSTAGDGAPTAVMAAAALAFMVRDIGIVAYFRFGPRPQRGDFGAVVALFLAYLIGSTVGRAVGEYLLLPGPTLASILAGAVMAAIVWFLAWGRIRAPERSET